MCKRRPREDLHSEQIKKSQKSVWTKNPIRIQIKVLIDVSRQMITLQSPLDSKETKPVNLKGNQSWIFIRRADAEAPILWPPDVKSWLIEKDPNAGKDWRQRRRRQQKIRWLDSIIDSMDMGLSLECCSPWGRKESTWLSDWTTILARGASLVAQW